MPELPEVEAAVRRLRSALVGKRIATARLLHPALVRRTSNRRLARIVGHAVVSVERRGKHQIVTMDDGTTIVAHFRMAGDWTIDRATDALPRFARAIFTLEDGSRAVLDDSRALSTIDVH